jgi:DNA-binding transcriptional LysR family regulator
MLDPELDLTHLIDDPYEVILPREHKLADKRRLSLGDLANEAWIASTNESGCRAITELACREAGFEPRIAFEADETMAAQGLVAAGVGVTILPRLALTTVHPAVVNRKLTGQPVRRIWAARLEGSYCSPASEAMVQVLKDVAEEYRETTLELAS